MAWSPCPEAEKTARKAARRRVVGPGKLGPLTDLGVTDLLLAWREGDRAALDRLMPLVHGELRRIAQNRLRGERPNHTLQPTALVNEAYLRLVDLTRVRWQNRAQFFAVAARLMRRVLVDAARGKHAGKRGGGALRVTFDEALVPSHQGDHDLIALDDAMQELAEEDPRKCQVVELRFFGGLSVEETAIALGVSSDTVARDWKFAKAWLRGQLDRQARQ
jgi:RNA polymerase sigma factor (TIGR02999 family)